MAKAKQVIVKARSIEVDKHGRGHGQGRGAVDIIIPYHGEYGLAMKLIASILNKTTDHPYLITLVDDGSASSGLQKILDNPLQLKDMGIGGIRQLTAISKGKEVPFIRCIRNDSQLGFAASLNVGIKETSGPLVCLMHSDCEIVEKKWLINLVTSLDKLKRRQVKMVSATSDNPGENYNRRLRSSPQVTIGDASLSRREDVILNENVFDKNYLPLYCALANRELFNRVGLFKEYPYHWYSDLEFACRMRKRGYMQGISVNSWVRHIGGGTVNSLCEKNPEIREIMEGNRLRCIADIKNLSSN